ncbi:hypothetical protein V5O48_019588, partial [Marasmius crinis-equi]
WDSMANYACDDLGSLELSVDESSGSCCWRLPPARSVARCLDTAEDNALKQSVFVRGFWINRSDGQIGSGPPPLRPGYHGGEKGGEGDTDYDEDRGGSRYSRSAAHRHGSSSSSNAPSPGQASRTNGGHSESLGSLLDSTVSPDELSVDKLELRISTTDLNW